MAPGAPVSAVDPSHAPPGCVARCRLHTALATLRELTLGTRRAPQPGFISSSPHLSAAAKRSRRRLFYFNGALGLSNAAQFVNYSFGLRQQLHAIAEAALGRQADGSSSEQGLATDSAVGSSGASGSALRWVRDREAERERERLRARLQGKISGGESHKKPQPKSGGKK